MVEKVPAKKIFCQGGVLEVKRILIVVLGIFALVGWVAADLPYPIWICGMHDTGGESHMIDKGTPGWVVIAVAIGNNPNDHTGADYTYLSNQGLGVIVRLNNGWNPNGTIPYQDEYENFAQRCANYVAASPGCRIWIIGNEPNLSVERPNYRGYEEVIYPDMYAECYTLCRNAIKSVPGHENDIVVTAAVGNWNIETGDWLDYFENMLNYIGAGNLDGIAVHTYTHGTDPNLIFSNEKGGNNWYWHFRSYIDVMNRIPESMRDLPVYITETDQCEPWADTNSGWVKNAYYEINSWNNTSGNQKIHALCLYRWQTYDSYYITGKWGVINDWRDAMDYHYRWNVEPQGENLSLSAVTYLECGHNREYQRGKAALDGYDTTKWCCMHNGMYTAGDHILTLDLGANCTVTGYVVKHASVGGEATYLNTKEFYIESAPSLYGPWSEEFHVVNQNQESSNALSYPTPKQLRYVRIRVVVPNYNADWVVRLPEFEVWGYRGGGETVKFEAEDYDGGANATEGIDYHDSDSVNEGGEYRSDGVDIEICSEGGYNVGWIYAGEWLVFPLNGEGVYQPEIRYAATQDATCHIEIDGTDVTGPINLPSTGGWQNWATVKGNPFSVNPGWRKMKFVADSPGFNLNYIQLSPSPDAQDLLTNGGFETGDLAGWTSWGQVDGVQVSGEWFASIPSHSGTYYLGTAASCGTKNGGVYQRVPVKQGASYTASVWIYIYRIGGNAGDDANRVGIDPTGGTDPGSGAIVWSAYSYSENQWGQISVSATAGGDYMTVFLQHRQLYANQWNINCFDDAELVGPPPASDFATSPAGWFRAGWNLISVPISPVAPDANSVFNELREAGNVIENNLYAYEGAYLLYPSDFNEIELGKAYWLYLTTGAQETVAGTAATGSVQIALANGWNLVGHPFKEPVALASCSVSNGSTTLTMEEAVNAGWLQVPFYYYDGASYKLLALDTSGDDQYLRPWYGYWVLTYQSNLTLIVPEP